MKLLLDTHTFLWFVNGDVQVSPTARQLIQDTANASYVSAASLWEMAIKISLGKLSFPQPFATFISEQIQRNGFIELGIAINHTAQVAVLPFPLADHRDPFDRLLIAQATVEQMAIVSRDGKFDAYGIQRFW
ncbi:MAG: type II toxin-antitoxin system VapC family toxin [Chloroflexota bacterium]|nr:type II toxin-antitoxin system VapC family toxin [Chloroflexota bacterium]